jgi:hypothetical protein
MTEQEVAMACAKCEASIDRCEFCDEPGCGTPICYQCLAEALGQAVAHPHPHGG